MGVGTWPIGRLEREILKCDFKEPLFLSDIASQLKKRNVDFDNFELRGRLRKLKYRGVLKTVRVLKDNKSSCWINKYNLNQDFLPAPILNFIS